MDTILYAEIFGVLALIFGLIAHQMKQPRVALWFLCIPCVFWILHFSFMVEISGLIISFVALIRNVCAAKFSDKDMKAIIAICLILCFVLIIPAVSDAKDLLPLGAAVAISAAIYMRDKPLQFRLYNFLGELSWLGYALCIASMSLSLASSLMLVSITISVMRHDLHPIRILARRGVYSST